MPFSKPQLGNLKAKILLIGSPGAGKTYGALTFPRPAVIDTEGSVDLYADQFDFVSTATKSLKEASALTQEIARGQVKMADGSLCETLIVDSMTPLYNAAQHAMMKQDGDINMQAWGLIKRQNGQFLEFLYHKAPVHVVCTAWEKDKFAGTDKKSGELLVDGKALDGDRKMTYAFDLIFWLSVDKGVRYAECVKARGIFGNAFKAGQKIKGGFSWALIEPILAQYKDRPARAVTRTEDETLDQDRDMLQADDHTTQLRYALGAFREAYPLVPKDEIAAAVVDQIEGHFDLQTRPRSYLDLTPQQLKWAGDYFARAKAEAAMLA